MTDKLGARISEGTVTPSPQGLITAGALALAAVMGIGRFLYTPVMPEMQRAAGLSAHVAGSLATANYLGYLVGALVTVFLDVAKLRRPLLVAGLIGSAGLTASMAATTSAAPWLFMRFGSGVASALVFVAATDFVLDSVQPGRRYAVGWFYGGVGTGIALSGLITPPSVDFAGWRGPWLAGAVLIALVIPFVLLKSPGGARHRHAAEAAPAGPDPMRLPFALLVIAYLLEGAGYIITGTYLVTIVGEFGPAWLSASAWVLVGLAAIPSCPLWAWAAQRFGQTSTLLGSLLLQAVGLALPAWNPHPVSVVISSLIFGGTFMAIVTLIMPLGRQWAGRSAAASAPVLITSYGLGQVLGPPAAEAMSTGGSLLPALWLAGGLVLAAALIVLLAASLTRRRPSPG